MKEWIEKAKENSYSSKFTIEGSRIIRLLIAEIKSLDAENQKQQEKIGELKQRENNLLGQQMELKIEYDKVVKQLNVYSKKEYKEYQLQEELKQLKQDYNDLRAAAENVDWQEVWNIIHFFLLDEKTIEEKKSEIVKQLNQISKLQQALAEVK